MSATSASLRDARIAAGLSQADLAAAAGVSRQAVGAIEAGRHPPGVGGALALSRAGGRTVEEIFAAGMSRVRPVLGRPLAPGAPVIAARVGDDLLYAPPAAVLAHEGWPQPNAVLGGDGVRLLPGADLDGLVVIGCDPALAAAAALVPGDRVVALAGSTATA